MRFSRTPSISSVHRYAANHAGPSTSHCNTGQVRTWSRGHGRRAIVSRQRRERAVQLAVGVDHASSHKEASAVRSSTYSCSRRLGERSQSPRGEGRTVVTSSTRIRSPPRKMLVTITAISGEAHPRERQPEENEGLKGMYLAEDDREGKDMPPRSPQAAPPQAQPWSSRRLPPPPPSLTRTTRSWSPRRPRG